MFSFQKEEISANGVMKRQGLFLGWFLVNSALESWEEMGIIIITKK